MACFAGATWQHSGTGIRIRVGSVVRNAAATTTGTIGGVESGELVPSGLEAGAVVVGVGGFVADVLVAAATADGAPAEGAADVLDDVPGVESFSEGADAEGAA